MGNFLDNSPNLSSEFLRSFVTFLSTNKTLPREQNPTDTWFFGVISVDAVGQISSRQEETSAQISSDNLYYNEQPTSPPALTCLSPNPQQKLFLFSWQFHNYHFNFLHSRIIIPHEPVRLQTINPAALVLCSLKVCFQYSPAARVPNNWTDLPPRRNKWPDRRSWAPPHNYHTFTWRNTLIYRRVSSQDHPSKIEYQTLDIALLK